MKDNTFKILLIEDNPGDARLIREFLSEISRASYHISVAERFSEGIAALASGNFDVVLLDLSLPDSSGLETLTKMRSHIRNTAVIVLTGLDDEETAVEAVRTGAQDYLIKGQLEAPLLSRSISYAVERKQLESRLRQGAKMEAVGTLAGGIAHDFNNILGIILGNTELAMRGISEDRPVIHNLEQVLTACFRAEDVIRQLLFFCRKTEQIQKPINIVPIIKEALKLLRSSIPTTVEIRPGIPEYVGTIMGDPIQIHQVLINLCINAAHAMREKGGILEVSLAEIILTEDDAAELGELKPGSYVRLNVRDTGHGISPEIMGKIFDPYFTTKPAGEGTGMGLGIVRSIVKNCGGEITVAGKPGKGTTFDLYFPSVDPADTEMAELISVPMPGRGESVLFVDDEPQIVEVVNEMLKHVGYKVTALTDSSEAVAIFRSQPDKFDLVISDMTMPRLTGIDVAKEVMRVRPDIPVILCSGFSEEADIEKAKKIGVREYIMKPFPVTTLAKVIRKVLDISLKDAKTANRP